MDRATRPTRFILLLLAATILAAPLYAAPHRGSHNLRTEIVAIEQQWRQAALSGDTDAMEHLLSEDYLGIMPNGEVVTKPQQLDRMKTHDFVFTKLELSDVKIKLLSRHAAIVTSLAQVDGTADDRPIHGSFRYTRVYQRLPGSTAWKITSFEATRVPERLASAARNTTS
jgi:ketosteroid isomerase-like protein